MSVLIERVGSETMENKTSHPFLYAKISGGE